MTYYDRIFEEAIGNYGLITSSQAKAIGIPSVELVKLAQRGRLTRLGYGVYKLAQYLPAPDGRDAYADSLALVDKDAYLYGQSVLTLHHLCPTNPARVYVATPRRIRKKLDHRFDLPRFEGIRVGYDTFIFKRSSKFHFRCVALSSLHSRNRE